MATAMDSDLFLAILALDAYNRNYNPGMTSSGLGGSQIGDATVLAEDPDSNTSFYAVAYSWKSKTIISYRGTAGVICSRRTSSSP